MADFELAVAKTIKNEGEDKYTDRDNDRGGPTKYGISFKFIKTYMRGNFTDEQCINKVKSLTLLDSKRLYKEYFWNANRYGEINDQAIAEKVFDMAVLFGAPKANKCAQRALELGDGDINIDGIIGNITLRHINSFNPRDYFYSTALEYYLMNNCISICNKDKTQTQFLLGWLNRVMS